MRLQINYSGWMEPFGLKEQAESAASSLEMENLQTTAPVGSDLGSLLGLKQPTQPPSIEPASKERESSVWSPVSSAVAAAASSRGQDEPTLQGW